VQCRALCTLTKSHIITPLLNHHAPPAVSGELNEIPHVLAAASAAQPEGNVCYVFCVYVSVHVCAFACVFVCALVLAFSG
jgi:hypothetical protein